MHGKLVGLESSIASSSQLNFGCRGRIGGTPKLAAHNINRNSGLESKGTVYLFVCTVSISISASSIAFHSESVCRGTEYRVPSTGLRMHSVLLVSCSLHLSCLVSSSLVSCTEYCCITVNPSFRAVPLYEFASVLLLDCCVLLHCCSHHVSTIYFVSTQIF